MKLLFVLVCYINHSSGHVSYFATAYRRVFLQYAANNMKRAGS
jgi:hypothetical protein